MNGVSAAGVALGGMTLPQALAAVQDRVDAYASPGAHRVVIGDAVLTPALSDLGLSVDVQATIDRAYLASRTTAWNKWFSWPGRRVTTSVPLVVTLRQKALSAYLDGVSVAYTRPVQEPSLQVVQGVVTEVPGTAGQDVVVPEQTGALSQAVQALTPITVTLTTKAIQPQLGDADIAEAKRIMEMMLSGPLTLTYEKRTFTVSAAQLADWVRFAFDSTKVVRLPKEGMTLTLDRDAVATYLATLDVIVGVPSQATEGYEAEVLGEYAYKNFQGRAVHVDDTLTHMLAAAQEAEDRTAELVVGPSDPAVTMLPAPAAPKETPKVISVDTAKQTLFAYENGKLKFWTHVSTGLKGYDTPTGEWKIYNKTPIQWMIGQGYALPNVKWVMAYDGDYTLHTAYWHNDFGKPKSHGCTNMSEQDAKWLYDWAEVGTPVIIYKSA